MAETRVQEIDDYLGFAVLLGTCSEFPGVEDFEQLRDIVSVGFSRQYYWLLGVSNTCQPCLQSPCHLRCSEYWDWLFQERS